MREQSNARPRLGGNGRAGNRVATVTSGQHYHSTFEPAALQVFKRGRWCTVAKLTFLDGGNREPILAIVHRNQHGTASRVSLTISTIQYAREHGAKWFYFRRDTTGEMWRMSLAEVEKCPLGPSIGGSDAERYIEIVKMERVPWQKWAWADKVVKLSDSSLEGNEPEPQPKSNELLIFGEMP